ncbi:MAG: DUF5671 domain-containing protein [bacterium]|nr:DUF5671 domain-containing protein [bacterium]
MAQPKQTGGTASRSTAAEVFSYLLLFLVLYIGVFAFLALLFDFIDVWFEGTKRAYAYAYGGGQNYSFIFGTSALVVVWPIFIIMSWLTGRWMLRDASRKNIGIRRWLTYLALFVSAVTLIIDLIVLVYNFLSGGLTTNFLLKVVAVLVVAAAVFGYYLWDLRRSAKKSMASVFVAVVTSVIVLATLVGGFFIVGTPSEQRAERFDSRRLSDLYQIQSEVISYYSSKNALPKTLADLETDVTGYLLPVDPFSGESYTYNSTGDLTFELCATFELAQSFDPPPSAAAADPFGYPVFDPYTSNWNHLSGEHCFDREIDPERLTVTISQARPPATPPQKEPVQTVVSADPVQVGSGAQYTDPTIGYTADLPEGWTAEQVSFEGLNDPFCQEPSSIVGFSSANSSLSLEIGIRDQGDTDVTIWCRTGVGAGAFEPADLITIDGTPVEPSHLVYEDRVIELFIGVGGSGAVTIGDYELIATINSSDVSQASGDLLDKPELEDALSILESLDLP